MLHAILTNKAGRSLGSDEVNWRELFAASEDSLTSTIFGSLFYLPVELFWHIINKSCYTELPTIDNPKIISFEFWPHWSGNESYNSRLVEPDVFIRTKNLDIIIEAKKFDNTASPQKLEQWQNEFQGYLNEYGDDSKQVILLAIGGVENELPETVNIKNKSISILKCRWLNVLLEVKRTIYNLEKSKGLINSVDSSLIILNDIVKGFNIHGYLAGTWLEDDNFDKLKSINYTTLSPFFTFEKLNNNN